METRFRTAACDAPSAVAQGCVRSARRLAGIARAASSRRVAVCMSLMSNAATRAVPRCPALPGPTGCPDLP